MIRFRFTIHYATAWGESLYVEIEYIYQDGNVKRQRLAMSTDDGIHWHLETTIMQITYRSIRSFKYNYQVEDTFGNIIRREWNLIPRLYHLDNTTNYTFLDNWKDIPLQQHLFTNAYITTTKGHYNDSIEDIVLPIFCRTAVFKVSAPQLHYGQSVGICGNLPALGGWNTARFVKMKYSGQAQWLLSVDITGMPLPMEYKYIVIDDNTNSFASWEQGDNRVLPITDICDKETLILDGGTLRIQEQDWRIAGCVIPIFSLKSESSCGVGDFTDLKKFISWIAKTGMKIIQILPINDTTKTHTWEDSYPYNVISVHALHPHYIDLEAAGELNNDKLMDTYRRQRQELNAMTYSNYEAVDKVKTAYLKELYKQERQNIIKNEDYINFVEENNEWLLPYATFCSLREKYGNAHYYEWKECAMYDPTEVKRYCNAHKEDITYHCFVQYLLHIQLQSATDYARSLGIALKGDIPIGVCRDSVETWMYPKYFNIDTQTGAPPDAFTSEGQNWGFPTYNWNAIIKEDHCIWWQQRLKHMERYFDAIRIDHVLGFFRIWEIPYHAMHGTLGHFSPALPLTIEEIERAGLPFRENLFTKPVITDDVINHIFTSNAQYVRNNYLFAMPKGQYQLKDMCDTQRKVYELFKEKKDEFSLKIKEGLYKIIANVLFVEDTKQPKTYHPRIEAYRELVFNTLGNDEKEAYMRIYSNFFYSRHDALWTQTALHRLSETLYNTRMLVCAEDLGFLPSCVESTLNALKILSLEIQTMPKYGDLEFACLENLPKRSVSTISTHDMPPLRMWWEENTTRAQRYYNNVMKKEGMAPKSLPSHLAELIVSQHLNSPSMICLLSLQDWLATDHALRSTNPMEERINVPEDSSNKWQWRMHLTIEKLQEATRFNSKMRAMIRCSGR